MTPFLELLRRSSFLFATERKPERAARNYSPSQGESLVGNGPGGDKGGII